MRIPLSLGLILGAGLVVSCGGSGPDQDDAASPLNANVPSLFEIQDEVIGQALPAPNPDRTAFFGDLHVHTVYSFDAYAMGTLATPYDAYRFAKGEPIPHAAGFDLQLEAPLDFYAVTDHAMFLGVAKEAADTTTDFSKYEMAEPLHDLNAPDNMGMFSLPGRLSNFAGFLPAMIGSIQSGDLDREEVLDITRSAWADIIRAADLHRNTLGGAPPSGKV